MQLIHTPIHADLRQAGVDLLEGIESGEITGLGIVATTRSRRFFVDVFGSMLRDPHAARGYVAELDDCLREIGRQKRNTNTTR